MDSAGRDLHPGTLAVSRQHPTGSGMQPPDRGAFSGIGGGVLALNCGGGVMAMC
jgi:hypothetical protein